MSIFDRLLELTLAEDVTETTWWTDAVFRHLERDSSDQAVSAIDDAAPADPSAELL